MIQLCFQVVGRHLSAEPAFDLELFMTVSQETRINADLMDRVSNLWDRWLPHAKAVKLDVDGRAYLLVWLDPEVEDSVDDAWEETHGFSPKNALDAWDDADGDGLTAREEFELGGDPALEDTDGDGYDNAAEETAGTHPLDAGSFFAMDALAPGPPVALQWSFLANRAYDVWFTPDLQLPFQPLTTGLATNAYVPESNGFYRLRIRK